MFSIEIADQSVNAALAALASKVANPRPVLEAIGKEIVSRTKDRFDQSVGPDGRPWAPNTAATMAALLAKRGGFKKSGELNKKGRALAAGKKPLIGESGSLAKQFHVAATPNDVVIGNSMIYAAMQQFGGTRAQFPHLWGDIPARPFLPVRADGSLYEPERNAILDALQTYYQGDQK